MKSLFEENVLNEFAIELKKEDKIEIELNMMEMVDQIWKQEQTNIAMTTSVFHETKPHRVSLVELNASIEIDKNVLNKYVNENSNSKVCSSVHKGSQDQLLFIQTLINKARKKALLDTGATLNYISYEFYCSQLIQDELYVQISKYQRESSK